MKKDEDAPASSGDTPQTTPIPPTLPAPTPPAPASPASASAASNVNASEMDATAGAAMAAEKLTLKERVDVAVEAWKKAVDVQQHFNDIELRIRNLAITVLGAVLSVAGLILKDARTSLLPGFIVIGGGILCGAFYFMDRWWYHRLLHGAVEGGRSMETFIIENAQVPIGLAHKIKETSAVATWFGKMRSDHKINAFYLTLIIVALLFAIGFFFSAVGARGRVIPSSAVAAPPATTVRRDSVIAPPIDSARQGAVSW